MSLTRRRFLGLVSGGGAAAAAASALPGCAPDYSPAPRVTVGAPVDGALRFRLADVPALDRTGGAVTLEAPTVDPILVIRTSGDGFAAMSATCTHQGCPLGYEPPDVICPCHLSRFDDQGRVLHPPAKAPLETRPVTFDPVTGEVVVTVATFPPVVAGQVRFPFAAYPALAAPGGYVTGRPVGFDRDLIVMALAAGGFAALTARCPHAGCTVGYSGGSDAVVCPCHGSRFGTDGSLVVGPATVGLDAFPAAGDAGGVTVTLG